MNNEYGDYLKKRNEVKKCLFRLKIQQPKNCTLSKYELQLESNNGFKNVHTIVLIILKLYQVTSLIFNFGHIRLWCNVWAT